MQLALTHFHSAHAVCHTFCWQSGLPVCSVAGDSLTVGYGNLGNGTCRLVFPPVPHPDYEDATQAWGALAAEQLEADYQLICW